ncbi:CLUMA_CG008346, isoform A [Clunio marinus]|uniref:CLUMA_CG008346, isoform A n=1 Tax=Clunio marinus TaxID=568069 RepID=A0A1J1I7C5_9DIPT|nr:CLUMA_CG008346, isoform A [Clunio marinus]
MKNVFSKECRWKEKTTFLQEHFNACLTFPSIHRSSQQKFSFKSFLEGKKASWLVISDKLRYYFLSSLLKSWKQGKKKNINTMFRCQLDEQDETISFRSSYPSNATGISFTN